MRDEPEPGFDPNKFLANVVVMAMKEAIQAIWEKLKTSPGEEITKTPVEDAIVDISRLKPWRRFEKAVLVILEGYPGLVEILQDDNTRKKLLIYDTGAGVLFTTQDIRSYLAAAKVSYISGVISEVENALIILERSFLFGAYSDSTKSLFNDFKQELDGDYRDLVELRFEHLGERARRAGIKEFVHLQIPIVEYEWRLRNIFHEIAIICLDCVELTIKFIGKLPSDRLMRHGDRILRTALAASSSINTLKVLCDKYALDESYRLTEALNSLRNLEKKV